MEALDWLLEVDSDNPGVRYRTLLQLLDRQPDDSDVIEARAAIMRTGLVPRILAAQDEGGYWLKPGPGYSPKYRGTVWQIIQLAHFGADPADDRVRKACEYVLSHSQTAIGGFGASDAVSDRPPSPSSALHCLNGNLLASLIELGWLDDRRIWQAIRWQALAITGEGGEVPYFKSGTSGPGFGCGINLGQPCAWGANKALKALLSVPEARRDDSLRRALGLGAELLLSRDPAVADYPYSGRVSRSWFRFGLPLSYWSDVMETVEVLAGLGYGDDKRLDDAFELILSKRDADGRWHMEASLNGKTWVDVERRGCPSKWLTLRALTLLRKSGRAE